MPVCARPVFRRDGGRNPGRTESRRGMPRTVFLFFRALSGSEFCGRLLPDTLSGMPWLCAAGICAGAGFPPQERAESPSYVPEIVTRAEGNKKDRELSPCLRFDLKAVLSIPVPFFLLTRSGSGLRGRRTSVCPPGQRGTFHRTRRTAQLRSSPGYKAVDADSH